MELVVNRDSIEAFAEDGETVLIALIYPAATSQGLAFYFTALPPGTAPARVRNIVPTPLDGQA
jgi:Glycosyl hydrolases family 32 C terminal